MNRESILNTINNIVGGRYWYKIFSNDEIQYINDHTSFLPIATELKERIIYIKDNINNAVKCPRCNNVINYDHKHKKFNMFCSNECKYTPEGITYDKLVSLTSFLPNTINILERVYYYDNNLLEIQTCIICNNPTKFDKKHKKFNLFCSDDCQNSDKGKSIINDKRKDTYSQKTILEKESVNNKRKNTNIDKYGVENTYQSKELQEKMKIKRLDTVRDKYGVDYITQSKEFKEKSQKTLEENYGVDNPMKSDEIKEKQSESVMENYGVDNPMKSDEIKERQKSSVQKKYGFDNVFQNDKIKREIHIKLKTKYYPTFIKLLKAKKIEPMFNDTDYISLDDDNEPKEYKCLRCDKVFETVHTKVQKVYCPNHSNSSIAEFELYSEIQKLSPDSTIERNKRFLGTKQLELDIYLPDLKLGIEYHGQYWHSELYKEKDYHFEKYKFFKDRGITVIQVFESEWINSKDIIMSLISNKIGIVKLKVFARNCDIREIVSFDYRTFLETNHLQGYAPAKIKLGLYMDNELLQVMSFSKPRFNKKYDWENIRTATKMNTVVVGGFSRLLKNFSKQYKGSIISYVDVRYFTGKGYVSNGFTNIGHSNPNYYYFKRNDLILENRMKFQKHKLEKMLDMFDPNLTEHANMLDNGYLRIYDAGNLIMVTE